MAVVVICGLAVGGCAADTISEQAVENAIEEANPSLDVDVEDGGGGVSATDEEGNEIGIGTKADVPDGFPSEVPLPDGDLTASLSSGDEYTLTYQVAESDPAAVLSAYQAALTGAGFSVDSTADVGLVGSFTATGNGYEVNVVTLGAGEEGTALTINVMPA